MFNAIIKLYMRVYISLSALGRPCLVVVVYLSNTTPGSVCVCLQLKCIQQSSVVECGRVVYMEAVTPPATPSTLVSQQDNFIF